MNSFWYAWLLAGIIYACIVVIGLNIYDKRFIEQQNMFSLTLMVLLAVASGFLGLGLTVFVFIKEAYKSFRGNNG